MKLLIIMSCEMAIVRQIQVASTINHRCEVLNSPYTVFNGSYDKVIFPYICFILLFLIFYFMFAIHYFFYYFRMALLPARSVHQLNFAFVASLTRTDRTTPKMNP